MMLVNSYGTSNSDFEPIQLPEDMPPQRSCLVARFASGLKKQQPFDTLLQSRYTR